VRILRFLFGQNSFTKFQINNPEQATLICKLTQKINGYLWQNQGVLNHQN